MIAKIVMLIAFVTVFGFVFYILFTKEKTNLAFVKYMLYAYPFLGIDLLPSYFSFNIFDLLTILFFFFLFLLPESFEFLALVDVAFTD